METTAVRESARRRVRLVAAAVLLVAAVAGLRTLDADPAAAQDPDVTWDDSWAEEDYDAFLQETNSDPEDVPTEPNAYSTPEDWRMAVEAMGKQPGWNKEGALRVINSLDDGVPVYREEAARIMCVGIGCNSDSTSAQISTLANGGITTGRTGACIADPNSEECHRDFDAGSTTTNAQTITFLRRVIDKQGRDYPPSGNIIPDLTRGLNLRASCGDGPNGGYAIYASWSTPPGYAASYSARATGTGWSTGLNGHYYVEVFYARPYYVYLEFFGRRTSNYESGHELYVAGGDVAGPVCQLPPTVSVVGPVSAVEGDPLVFTLILRNRGNQATTVRVSTRDDTRSGARTATSGDDYVHLSETVVFPRGRAYQTVTVDTVDDSTDEYYETVVLRINSVSGADGPAIGDLREAEGTIIDNDDTIPAEISIDDGAGDEAGMVRFNVRLAEPHGKVVAASVVTSESSPRSASAAQACGVDDASTDYLSRSGRVIFDPGETVKEFTVQTCDDSAEEGHETLNVTLSNPINATLGVKSAEGVIRDDDIPVLSISGPASSVDEDTGGTPSTATFAVSLDRVGLQTITVTASTISGTASGAPCAPGGDFVHRTRTVTFHPGDRVESFDVATCADDVPENDEDFSVVLSGPVVERCAWYRYRERHDRRQRRADGERLCSGRGCR